ASSRNSYSAGSSAAPSRLSSTSRSPGSPMASSSQSPPGSRTLSTTFFSVSAAVTSRPSKPGRSARLAQSTSVAMVAVSGVSYTLGSGSPSIGRGSGAGVTTASTLAAYPDSGHRTKVSSPTSLSARNSSDALPPIAPDTAETM